MPYDNWKKRLEVRRKFPTVAARRAAIAALKINFSQPNENDEGYYRKPITEKDVSGNGKSNIIGWVPVAYYLYGGVLVGDIGNKPMETHQIYDEQLWSWVVSNPIPYETYLAVQNGAPWPDMPTQTEVEFMGKVETFPGPEAFSEAEPPLDPIERIIGRNHNQPPTEEVLPPEVEHATAIDNAIGAAPETVSSEAEAATAAGSMNRIAELRLAAEKAGKAVYEPIFKQYKTAYNVWNPPVARAEAAEKRIKTAILTFRENERKRLAKLAAEEAQRQREIEEAAQRVADRAIAAGVPEPAPPVEPEPPPVIAQPAPIQPTYGRRKVREELKKFAVIQDRVAVCLHFIDNPELSALIEKLATNAIRAGVTVPGTTTREGLI